MQIKSALFCLATTLVVFTSAGPVGLNDGTLIDRFRGLTLDEIIAKNDRTAEKLMDAA
jgi:hypothetical protein